MQNLTARLGYLCIEVCIEDSLGFYASSYWLNEFIEGNLRLITSRFSLKDYSGLLFPEFLAQSASKYFIMHLFNAFALG
jgi:hypothetical protein